MSAAFSTTAVATTCCLPLPFADMPLPDSARPGVSHTYVKGLRPVYFYGLRPATATARQHRSRQRRFARDHKQPTSSLFRRRRNGVAVGGNRGDQRPPTQASSFKTCSAPSGERRL